MYNLGIKEVQKYRDISWIMSGVDVQEVLEKMGVGMISVLPSGEYQGLCPDHSHYIGKESSHPNWIVCPKTGCTFCRTEGRSSNLIWTVSRIFKCHPRKAVELLIGDNVSEECLKIASMRKRMNNLNNRVKKCDDVKAIAGLDEIAKEVENRSVTNEMYDFFIKPPNKTPTNILRSTVDHYKVFHRSYGFYKDRAFVPCFLNGDIRGFCAIDILGKERWMKLHPLKEESEYKKIRYPLNFKAGEYLFGYDDCKKNSEIILTEGAREVMKLWQEGFTNSVSVFGGNITDGHIKLLSKKSPSSIILMFDGDKAGYGFNEKAKNRLSRLFDVKVGIVPLGKDPKNLGKKDIERIIRRAK